MRLSTLPILACLAGAALCQAPPKPVDQRERWNKTLSSPNPVFNTEPNRFLAEAIKGRKPGKAVDIGLGQGRNSIYLAQQGWEVTGVDISDEGMRLARERAAKLGVKLHTVLQSADDYDFGRDQWDLIIGLFMHEIFSNQAERVKAGLKPGGLVVVEAFHDDFSKTVNRQLGYKNNELLRAFDGLRIVHYEDRVGPADWNSGKDAPIVRFIARKE